MIALMKRLLSVSGEYKEESSWPFCFLFKSLLSKGPACWASRPWRPFSDGVMTPAAVPVAGRRHGPVRPPADPVPAHGGPAAVRRRLHGLLRTCVWIWAHT